MEASVLRLIICTALTSCSTSIPTTLTTCSYLRQIPAFSAACTSDDRAGCCPYQCLSLLVLFLLSQVCILTQEDSGEHWLDRGEQHRRRRLCEQPERWSGTGILHRTQPERGESCSGYGGKFTEKLLSRHLGFSKSEFSRVWIWAWNCETGGREKLDEAWLVSTTLKWSAVEDLMGWQRKWENHK